MCRFACVLGLILAPADVGWSQHRGGAPPDLVWDKLKGSCPESLDWSSLRGNFVVVSIDNWGAMPDDFVEWNGLLQKFQDEPMVYLRVVGGAEFILDQALKRTAYKGCVLYDPKGANLDNFKLMYSHTVIVDQFGLIAGYTGDADESLLRALLDHEKETGLTERPPKPRPHNSTSETEAPSYDVHISAARRDETRELRTGGGERYEVRNQPLKLIIMDAWEMPMARIVFPDNFDEGRYDVIAHIPVEDRELLLGIVREAVENKFRVRLERETRNAHAYLLTSSGEASSQLQPASDPARWMSGFGPTSMIGTGQMAANIAAGFQGVLEVPVVDKTGWKGKYDFSATSALSGREAAFDMAHQLGLELTPAEEPIEMLVVRSGTTTTARDSTDPPQRWR